MWVGVRSRDRIPHPGALDPNSLGYSSPRKIGKSISRILLLIFLGNASTTNSTTTRYRHRKSTKLNDDKTRLGWNGQCNRAPLSERIGAGPQCPSQLPLNGRNL